MYIMYTSKFSICIESYFFLNANSLYFKNIMFLGTNKYLKYFTTGIEDIYKISGHNTLFNIFIFLT